MSAEHDPKIRLMHSSRDLHQRGTPENQCYIVSATEKSQVDVQLMHCDLQPTLHPLIIPTLVSTVFYQKSVPMRCNERGREMP